MPSGAAVPPCCLDTTPLPSPQPAPPAQAWNWAQKGTWPQFFFALPLEARPGCQPHTDHP